MNKPFFDSAPESPDPQRRPMPGDRSGGQKEGVACPGGQDHARSPWRRSAPSASKASGSMGPDSQVDRAAPGLDPPRFSLRTLFVLVTGVAAFLSVWMWWGPIVGATVLLVFLVVFAHVAGTAIGSQLRAKGRHHAVPSERPADAPQRAASVRADQYAPVTKLSRRAPLGGAMIVITSLGAMAGGIGGALLMRYLYPATFDLGALAVGCLAGATLGAFWMFWISSLFQVLGGAWRQAHRHGRSRG